MNIRYFTWILIVTGTFFWGGIAPAQAAEEGQIRNFLKVTGFDVAITSIQQGAMAGPALTGEGPEVFGRQWVALAKDVFEPEAMVSDAVKMIGAILPDELLTYGVAFYTSPLGKHLVEMENESHLAQDEVRFSQGEQLVSELVENQDVRLSIYREMNAAIGSTENTIKSIVEIQVRYLMAAISVGASDFNITEEDLRLMLLEQAGEMRESIEVNSLITNAYTYRDLTQDELIDYLSALQSPRMKQIYEVLNAVQYQIMADRYETLATRLDELQPEQEL